jgi:ADP-heptose:LPS heptosyltransferase
MYVTSVIEKFAGNTHIQPFQPIRIPDKVAGEFDAKYDEIAEVPKLYLKKYYVGCMKDGDKLLIKRLGGLGDVIWTLPVAKRMKELYPKCTINYLVAEKDVDLFKGNPYVDGVFTQPMLVSEMLEHDWILDYYESIERYAPASYKEAYDIHFEWAFNKELDGSAKGNIFLTDKEKAYADFLPEKYILFCLHASSPKRTYFYMSALIDKAIADGYNVVVSGQYPFKINEQSINLMNKLELRELFSVVNKAALVVCADSGNAHIASQLDRKTICLYSTVDSKTRAKYYDNVIPIESKEWCRPCTFLGEYCSKEPECLSRIEPETVYKEIKKAV